MAFILKKRFKISVTDVKIYVTLLIRYCYKSKCTEFECCCFKLKRNVDVEKEEDFMFNRENNNSPK